MAEVIMTLYTIFTYPRDEPDTAYLVRAFHVLMGQTDPVPGEIVARATSLEGARLQVPLEADACLPRADGDEPQIVETWI